MASTCILQPLHQVADVDVITKLLKRLQQGGITPSSTWMQQASVPSQNADVITKLLKHLQQGGSTPSSTCMLQASVPSQKSCWSLKEDQSGEVLLLQDEMVTLLPH